MFCHHCGHKLPDDARFCSQCGTGIPQAPQYINEKTREHIYDELCEVTLGGLDNGQITVEESKEISAFVLNYLDAVKDDAQLISFLIELAKRWPLFETIRTKLFNEMMMESLKGKNIREILRRDR